MCSLITFPEDVLIQGIGHMKHTSFKTKSQMPESWDLN